MLDLAFKLFDQIVRFWNFYVVSATVLVGWVFSRDDPWSNLQRWTVTIAFLGFVVFNLIGLISSYKALQVVTHELKITHNLEALGITRKALNAMVERFSMRYWKIGILFHIIVDGIVIYFLCIVSAS